MASHNEKLPSGGSAKADDKKMTKNLVVQLSSNYSWEREKSAIFNSITISSIAKTCSEIMLNSIRLGSTTVPILVNK